MLKFQVGYYFLKFLWSRLLHCYLLHLISNSSGTDIRIYCSTSLRLPHGLSLVSKIATGSVSLFLSVT